MGGDTAAKKGSWKQFFPVVRRLHLPWLWILIAFIVGLSYNQVLLQLPTLTSGLMSGELSSEALWGYILYYVLYTAVLCANQLLTYQTQCLAVRNARSSVWQKMLRVRMEYYDRHDPSGLMSTMTNDVDAAMRSMVSVIIGVIPDIYYVVMAMRTIGAYDYLLIVSVLLLFPVKLIYAVFLGRWKFRTQAGIYQEIGSLTAYLAERVRHLGLIKSYTNEPQELKNGERVAKQLFTANMRSTKLNCVSEGASALLNVLESLVTVVFGVVLLQRGRIDMKQWVAFFFFASALSTRFTLFINTWINIKGMHGAIARTMEVMAAPEEAVDESANPAAAGGTGLDFDTVSFSYGGKDALRNVSFSIPAGKTTVIVGQCGSGKTTTLSLIERFYQPETGEIRLGRHPLPERLAAGYRSQFAYVQQGADIFGGTLRETLTYGIKREVSDEEIWRAAERSGFAEYLKKQPQGLETRVSPSGGSMSGGQRQRLVLAREFLRDAGILLMDEPTSGLDPMTAKAVQDTIFDMFAGKTKVIVTHDLALTERADQVVLLDSGRLAGCGTCEELLRSCKLFRDMMELNGSREATT